MAVETRRGRMGSRRLRTPGAVLTAAVLAAWTGGLSPAGAGGGPSGAAAPPAGEVGVSAAAVNQAPAAVDDRYSKLHAVPLDVPVPGVLGNDTDADGDAMTAGSASDPAGGTVALNANGSFRYVPDPGFTGTDTFTYTVSDGTGATDTGLVTIVSKVMTAAPVATDDSYATSEDTPRMVPAPGVLGNDTDADGDTILAGSASDPPNGSVALSPNGAVTYTPDADFSGTDTFTYTVSDGSGGSDTGLVTLAVSAVNDAPVAGDDAYGATEDAVLNVVAPGVLGNDTDVEGNARTAGSAGDPAHGRVTLAADGSFTYTPDPDFAGTDTFTYTVTDTAGATDGGLVTVTVGAVNDAPVGVDDAYSTDESTALGVAAPGVLGNDLDADGDSLGAGSASDPAHGSVTLAADGSFTYTPDPKFDGTDSFTYVVSDGEGTTDTASVTITVVEALPVVSIGDVALAEGDTGSRAAMFTVSLDEPSASEVTVAYATGDATAAAPGDYTSKSGTLTFAPGSTSAKVKVPVAGDTADEADEALTVALSDPVGATIGDGSGTGTVVDDDPRTVAGPRLTIGDVAVHEGDAGGRAAVFTVSLSKPSTSYVTVRFTTANGTATKSGDYTRMSGTLSFAPGALSATLKVPVGPDTAGEGNETFVVNLSDATNATLTDAGGTGTIVDDD